MSLAVDCICGKTFRARDDLAGKRVKCPGCGEIVAIPDSAPAASRANDRAPVPPNNKAPGPTKHKVDIDALFRDLVTQDGSNLHVKPGRPPIFRVQGRLRETNAEPLTVEQVEDICAQLMDDRQRKLFDENGGTDLAHIVEHGGKRWRFRINIFMQMGQMAMIAQMVQPDIPNFEQLYLPPILERLCKFDQGMILVGGMTGCGKTTTIASMLDWINHNYRKHILTIEDPVEYVFDDDKCLINQREIGVSVQDFDIAMKHAVREDPDVILVGEMRDMDSFLTAMHAAETGHLVFGTIHCATAPSTIGRILDLFPQPMHAALRSSMAFNLKAIVVQKLVPTVRDEPQRVPAVEILLFNATVRKLILEEQDDKLADAISIGQQEGMQQFNESLHDFVTRGYISHQAAFESSPSPEELKMILKGISVKARGIL